MRNGAIRSDSINMEGKVNHLTVTEAVRNRLGYYDKSDLDTIISWQEEEAFTFDEECEFLKNV